MPDLWDALDEEKDDEIDIDDEKAIFYAHDSLEHEQALISKKKVGANAFTVERTFVNSKDFRDQFVLLPTNKNVQDSLYKEAGIILEMLDGKDEERLVAINARTGKKIIDNYSRTGSSYKTGFSTEEYELLQNCEDYIVLLHNHPDGSRPSGTDLITFVNEEKVKLSVIVGHDGDLYAIISVKDEVKNIYQKLYDGYLEKLGEEKEDSAKTLATNALYLLNANNALFEVRRYHNE